MKPEVNGSPDGRDEGSPDNCYITLETEPGSWGGWVLRRRTLLLLPRHRLRVSAKRSYTKVAGGIIPQKKYFFRRNNLLKNMGIITVRPPWRNGLSGL